MAEAVRRCVGDRLASELGPSRRADPVTEALAVCGGYRDPAGRSTVAKDHDAALADAYRA